MKPGRVFWGVFLIAVGVLLLLDRLDLLVVDLYALWRFWPLVLILWGIAALTQNKPIKIAMVVSTALLLASILAGFLSFSWLDYDDDEGALVERLTEEYDSTLARAMFRLDAAAGTFHLSDGTDHLADISVRARPGTYRLSRERIALVDQVTLALDRIGPRTARRGNAAKIRLHSAPLWEIQADVGAASADFDLSRFRLEQLDLDAGAAKVHIRMGSLVEEARVRLNAGASSVILTLPSAAGCEIQLDAVLSGKHLHDFEKVGTDLYRSENFATAEHRIYVDIDAGVSSVRVIRE